MAETVDMFRNAEIAVVEHFGWYGRTPANTRVNVGPGGARPCGTQKEFLFPTFEAGMLLKTNEA